MAEGSRARLPKNASHLIEEGELLRFQILAGQDLIGREKKIEIAENRAELGFPYGFLVGFPPSIL